MEKVRYTSLHTIPILTLSSTEVIIQLFQWNWDSIANECMNFIGPAGKSATSVSSVTPAVSIVPSLTFNPLNRIWLRSS